MKHGKVLVTFLLCASSFVFATPSGAAPAEQKPQDRFVMMDKDQNGTVNWAEFEAAMPQMRREAFDQIDADKNGEVSQTEWEGFRSSHGMGGKGMGGGMPGGMGKSEGMPGMPGMSGNARPGIMPPQSQDTSETGKPGIMPPAQ